jgi:RNA polymerase sigma-70 factor, ECF subfamily
LAAEQPGPDALAVSRETMSLASLAAIQLLPARQRAVLILRDVVDWSASEAAALLDTTVSAVKSALQHARATLRNRWPGGRDGLGAGRRALWSPKGEPSADQSWLHRFISAHEQTDPEALIAVLLAGRPAGDLAAGR